MGLLENLFETRSTLANPSAWLEKYFEGKKAYTGSNVTEETALRQSAVFGCVRIVSEAQATAPLHLYKRLERGKERATGQRLYWILKDEPNSEMSSYTFKEVLSGHVELWGNSFCEIERNQAGQIIALWPLRPDRMTVERRNGELSYVYQLDDKRIRLRRDQVWHIPGLGFDGMIGYNPVDLARQSIGVALGTEEFGARFFGNGAHPGLAVKHPGQLSEPAQNNLRASVEDAHKGLEKAHRIMILEEGMDIAQIGIPPESAQYIETRKFTIAEVARFWRMQLHKLQEMDQATFSNIEHQAIEHVQDTIQPRFTRVESAVQKDLIPASQKKTHFAEFLIDNLLRGDIQARYEAYAVSIQNGWNSPNDIREKENQNPYEGGDTYLAPMNMMPIQMLGQLPEQNDVVDEDDDDIDEDDRSIRPESRAAVSRRRVAESFRAIFEQTAERIVRAEIREVSKAVEREDRSEQGLIEWLEAYYAGHTAFLTTQMKPLIRSYGDAMNSEVSLEMGQSLPLDEAFVDAYVETYTKRHTSNSLNQLKKLIEESENPFDAVRERLDEWREKRVGKIAGQEMIQAESAFAKNAYSELGVTKLRWKTFGENCPYCNSLEGKVVGIEENFVDKGTTIQPSDADRPMTVRRNVGHPPVHAGCDCSVEPEL